MIIILEDSPERMKVFNRLCIGKEMLHFEEADKCIDALNDEPEVYQLWLDHDLGGEQLVDSNREDTGMEVVRFLVANDLTSKIKNIIVHSHNAVAHRIMVADLHKAGYSVISHAFSLLKEGKNVR